MPVSAPIGRDGLPIRERIGVFGPPKVGKTHLYLTIARWHQDLGSDAKFYAVSTDLSYEVLLMNEQFADLTNVEYTDVTSFEEMVVAARNYTGKMKRHDWISMDLMDAAWAFVQDEYARVVTSKAGGKLDDMGDLWATSGSTEQYPIAGWEWQMPNARYRILANNILLRAPGNVFLVYGQKELMKDSGSGSSGENVKTKEMFGHLGLKPAGQKEDPFRWHTILHVDSKGTGKEQVMATAGERWGNREHLGTKMSNGMVKDAPVEDFFMDYLVKIAGWEI